MPWTAKQAREKNSKIRSDGEAKMWVKVANRTLKAELEKGTGQEEAEAAAIKSANGAVREMHRKGGASVKAAVAPEFSEADYLLHSPYTGPFLTLGQRKQKGIPVHRYRKEIIKDGDYIKDETGQQFAVTPKFRQHWVASFRRMKQNGVKVHIPADHTDAAEANRGWVDDLVLDGDGLVMICGLVGDDAPALAKRNDVSIYVPARFVDGKGNEYTRPIRHVALTPVPVIPGLRDWEPLAACFALTLSEETSQMDWKKIQADLGIETELTDKNAAELILSAAGALKKRVVDLETEVKAAKKGAGDDKKTDEPPKIDPTLLSLAQENRAMKLQALVEGARITPAVRDELAKLYVDEQPLILALGRGGDAHDHFGQLVDLLAKNDPVELREQSGLQVLTLSRGGEEQTDVLVKDAEQRAKAAAG